MAFPTCAVIDDFNRADGALGPNWTTITGTPVVDTNLAANTDGVDPGSADWNVTQFGPDCEVYATFATRQDDTGVNVLAARLDSLIAPTVGYILEVYRQDVPGDTVNLSSFSTPDILVIPITLQDGDAFGMELIGNTINVYQKPVAGVWMLIGTIVDMETAAAGYVGFSLNDTTTRMDDFGACTLATPPTPATGAGECVECARLGNPFAPPAELDWYISPDGQTYQFDNASDDILLAFQGYGMPGIDYISQQGPFQHGKTLLDYRLQPRIIQLEHRRQSCDRYDYWANRGGLLNLLRPNRQYANQFDLGKLRKILPGNVRRDIDVLVQQGPQFAARNDGGDWLDFTDTIQFIAPDPTFYDPDTVIVTWMITVTDELFFFSAAFPDDLFFPCSFGTDVLTGTASIHYTGTWLAYPTFVMTGPINQPTIENLTTGEKIQLLYYVGVGEIVTIALPFGSKSVTNNFGANLIGTVSTDSDLATFHIAPEPEAAWCGTHPRPCGVNNFSVAGAGGVAGLTAIEMRYYTRYIGI